MTDYDSFLASKNRVAPAAGIEPGPVSPALFSFQADIARWALRRGRAAIFAGCGLGKTLMQMEWARQIAAATGGRVLILAPLAVSHQTVREGEKFGITIVGARQGDDAQGDERLWITNYEMLEKFDPRSFVGVVLDESSILKAYDGKTRTAIIEAFRATPYRLACTATPAPNDHMELGNHAEFLGVMTRTEMLATFFTHDGGETQKWRLKKHGRAAFWKWLCSWAVSLQKPSDLGYSDEGFVLPPLRLIHDVVSGDAEQAKERGLLFEMEARGLDEQRKARKASLRKRVDRVAELVNGNPFHQWLVWCSLNAEGDALEKAIPGAIQVSGSDSDEEKTAKLLGFLDGTHRVMVSKSSIFGFGLNLQNCCRVAYCGIDNSWESFYQSTRRVWRFGQKQPVEVHIVTSASEGAVIANIERKEADAAEMSEEIIANMKQGSMDALHATERQVAEYNPDVARGDGWELFLGDCVEVVRALPDESIHYTVYSPPFSSLYTYSASDRDMGNSTSYEQFFEHLKFLAVELLRVTMPGRLMSFHCMDLPTSKAHHGYIGIQDFRGDLVRTFREIGWILHSQVVIWKDPVTAMQRTKALGLLYKQLRKDSAMSRQGIPDYLVTMRKPGDNPQPVTHTPEEFPVGVWQRYASPVWMDINPSDTLQFRSAREDPDERHICPLQLQVIERALDLWSNPGDLVLSPFAGIGSEGYVARTKGRRFIGAELKRSYWALACKNLASAEPNAKGQQLSLLGDSAERSTYADEAPTETEAE